MRLVCCKDTFPIHSLNCLGMILCRSMSPILAAGCAVNKSEHIPGNSERIPYPNPYKFPNLLTVLPRTTNPLGAGPVAVSIVSMNRIPFTLGALRRFMILCRRLPGHALDTSFQALIVYQGAVRTFTFALSEHSPEDRMETNCNTRCSVRGGFGTLKNLYRYTVSLPECLHHILPHNVCFVCAETLPTEHNGVEK